MIIIDPAKDELHSATDETRWHINYFFADALRSYIELKGDECKLSRYSEDAPAVTLKSLTTNYDPTVTITINCYVDIDPDSSGYHLECDQYNALVGTINYETYKQGRSAITELGYKETGSLKYGQYTDITLYLGFLTNDEDLEYLSSEDNLDTLAKRIIEGAYGPPVRQIEDTDPSGNEDPYFYRFDTWQEADEPEGSTGEINETTYQGLPLRYLSINSQVSGYYDVDPNDENPVYIPKHYTWSTPLTYTAASTDCIFIGSLRAPSGSSPIAYMRIGDTEYTQEITDTTFTIVMFKATVKPGDSVYIGVQGTGRIDYSGIWVSPEGNLGTLDDPRGQYSIFPPGYRTDETNTAYSGADSIHIALTEARSLIERAQDQSGGVTQTIADETEMSMVSNSSSSDSGSYSSTTIASYAASLTGIVSILNNSSNTKSGIIDPNSVNISSSGLLSAAASSPSMREKSALITASNDIKNSATAVGFATETDASRKSQSSAIAANTVYNIEGKGNNLKI